MIYPSLLNATQSTPAEKKIWEIWKLYTLFFSQVQQDKNNKQIIQPIYRLDISTEKS